MYAALNIESSTGEVLILPLVVGTVAENKAILSQFPLLSDKVYMSWDHREIGKKIQALPETLIKNGKISKEKQLKWRQWSLDNPRLFNS